ncbi:MAG: Fic family protein [Deltaproteobacteria bacterium]|nr:Fic family protein [Deltaproteobacteria bacterium]
MFDPKFTVSNQTIIALTEIERLTILLNKAAIPAPVFDHIKMQCLVALTHFSTQIEGNLLSIEQVSGVVEKNRTFGLHRDENEVKNYFALLEKIPGLIKKHRQRVAPKLILECHSSLLCKIVSHNLRGRLRDVQNAIYAAGSKKIVYLPPEPKDVQGLIDDLCLWTADAKIHPIILAAIFHNQFVTVHPFIDGNGRSARFLTLFLLDIKGYDWKGIVPVDRYYADDRPLYYKMLQQDYSHNYYFGRHNTDFSRWIDYYVEGIKNILQGTLNQIELYKTQNVLLNNRQTKMLRYLLNSKSVTAQEYALRFNISARMAARDLRQLVEWGRLGVIGRARATKYFLR